MESSKKFALTVFLVLVTTLASRIDSFDECVRDCIKGCPPLFYCVPACLAACKGQPPISPSQSTVSTKGLLCKHNCVTSLCPRLSSPSPPVSKAMRVCVDSCFKGCGED